MFPGALEAFINLAPSPHWNRRISDPAYFRGKTIFTFFSSIFLMILYIVVVPSLSYCTLLWFPLSPTAPLRYFAIINLAPMAVFFNQEMFRIRTQDYVLPHAIASAHTDTHTNR